MIRLRLAILMLAFMSRFAGAQSAPVDVPAAVAHAESPVYPDVPEGQRTPVDVTISVDLDANGAIVATRVTSASNPAFDDLAGENVRGAAL